MIQEGSLLWQYLSTEERSLVGDGTFLLKDSKRHTDNEPTDFSYIVFPFAKLFEGFLKDLLRDLSIITERDYMSTHFRIGKALSPNLAKRLGRRSAFAQLKDRFGIDLADHLWIAWKEGRNVIFHYFPNNYRSLSRREAEEKIWLIIKTMEEAVTMTHVVKKA